MTHFRRQKTKRSILATGKAARRLRGNNQGRFKDREEDARKRVRQEAAEAVKP